MSRKRKNCGIQIPISDIENDQLYIHYYTLLKGYAISMFKWNNLPKTCDARFLELALFENGMAVFFEDEVLGYLALQTRIGGALNVYRIPVSRTAYSVNGYQKDLTIDNSVIIFNNYLRTTIHRVVDIYARRLTNLDRIIDINCNAQKTPILVTCPEEERLTMANLYEKYEGNAPVIFGTNGINPDTLNVLQTGAPFVADKMQLVKMKVWNEIMTFLGINNGNQDKKERLVKAEVSANDGQVNASRLLMLTARIQACEQINEMFGLDISVEFNNDLIDLMGDNVDDEEIEPESEEMDD